MSNGAIIPNSTINGFWSLFPNFPAFFRFDLVGYQAQVFPVILIVALGYWIERGLRRIVPEFLAIIVIPLGTVLLAIFLVFDLLGLLGAILAMDWANFFTTCLIIRIILALDLGEWF